MYFHTIICVVKTARLKNNVSVLFVKHLIAISWLLTGQLLILNSNDEELTLFWDNILILEFLYKNGFSIFISDLCRILFQKQ